MNINTFAIFLTLVEEMNFTKAAQRLLITQQSLSGHIKRLEEEYNVSLFERRPTLRLTAEGESMVFYAKQILRAQNSMCNEFADLSTKHTANLDIGMSSMRSKLIGKGAWGEFHRRYPNIRVRIVEKTTSALLEQMSFGDLGIMVGVDIRPVPGLHVIPVLKEHLCFVIHKELYRQYCMPVTEKEGQVLGREISIIQTREVPMLLPAKGTRLRISVERMYRTAGFFPRVLVESGLQALLYNLAKEGEGAAILSPMVFCDQNGDIELPEDCFIFRIRESLPSVVGIAYPQDAQITHYEEAMIEIIQDKYFSYGEAIAKLGLKG